MDDLKISTPVTDQNAKAVAPDEQGTSKADTAEYVDYVGGTGYGEELLKNVKKIKEVEEEQVIYGVYNNSDKGIFVRINDFLIDHSRITTKDKSYFFNMLAMMVAAGVPVVSAVKSLAKHTQNKRFARVLNTVSHLCETGSNLADAMSRFDDVFDESEVGIIRAGELSGRLNMMLLKLAQQLEKRGDLSMKLWAAAVYPIAVLSVLVLVAIGMLVWVLPTLLNLLSEGGLGGDKLPGPTRFLVAMQAGLVGYWWAILLAVFVLYGVFAMYFGTNHGAINGDYIKIKIPLVGNLLRKVYVLNFVGTLGLLIDSGLPVIKALAVTGNSIKNRIYKIKIQELIEQVRKGNKISDGLADTEFLFPPEIIQMLRVGEASANLAAVSEKISEQYQREVDNSLKKLTSVFEPLMILFVGLFVALLALAIMAPIFNLNSAVGGV